MTSKADEDDTRMSRYKQPQQKEETTKYATNESFFEPVTIPMSCAIPISVIL